MNGAITPEESGEKNIKGEKQNIFIKVPINYTHSSLNWEMHRENGLVLNKSTPKAHTSSPFIHLILEFQQLHLLDFCNKQEKYIPDNSGTVTKVFKGTVAARIQIGSINVRH